MEGVTGMTQTLNTQRLLELRRLTRALSEHVRGQLVEYLATLGPLLRSKSLLGSHIQGFRETTRSADRAFKELQSAYESVAGSQPFNLPRELKGPIAIDSSTLEIAPYQYVHAAKTRKASKSVTVTSPLKWVLNFSGYSLDGLREGLAGADPAKFRAQDFVLNFLILHVATSQKGIPQLFEALRLPISSQLFPDLGKLPITVMASAVPTFLPSDETIVESTEISGLDAFEEIADPEALAALRDPVKERLLEVVSKQRSEPA
jgi:hypothetical protein